MIDALRTKMRDAKVERCESQLLVSADPRSFARGRAGAAARGSGIDAFATCGVHGRAFSPLTQRVKLGRVDVEAVSGAFPFAPLAQASKESKSINRSRLFFPGWLGT